MFSAPEFLTYANGDRAQIVTVSYLTDAVSGTPRPDAEGLELRYFDLSALPGNLFSPNLPILEAIKEKFG